MNTTNPIVIDGQVFDRYSLSMSVSSSILPDGTTTGNAAVSLVPTRIADDGTVVTAHAEARTFAVRDMLHTDDPDIKTAALSIAAALQTLVYTKQL